MSETKFIFVTGGVCSSLGKGIVASSVAAILRFAGKSVAIMKLDPYLNVDPGTMSPFQHGEVFVLDDGGETDLDLGHYERFIDIPLKHFCSISTGKVYSEVLAEERDGKYLGRTIQVIPHITNKIREKVELAAKKMKCDYLVVEIGGTVGDIEGVPFIEVIRQMKKKHGKNLISMHLTLLPYLAASKEFKTKPTQLSVRELMRMGVNPDFIFARADARIPKSILKKIAFFCDTEDDEVIPSETVNSIYEVPLNYMKYGLGENLAKKLEIKNPRFNFSDWEEGVKSIKSSKKVLQIGLAGKYNELDDAYLSVIEATKSAGYKFSRKIEIVWIDTERIAENNEEEFKKLEEVAGIIVPGGFGTRGIEGKIAVAKYCRENKKPYLGLCLGSQIMAIEFARNVLGLRDATSEEFDDAVNSKNLVVHFMEDQRSILKKGGTMRLGSYPCILKSGTRAYKIYGTEKITERHRHRYEFNNKFREKLEAKGFIISGTSPDGNLVEVVEIKDHPFMIASQFHPEFLSRPFAPHPLFREFVKVCCGE